MSLAPVAPSVVQPASPQASVSPAVGPVWNGGKGQTLHDVLKKWSDMAGVELYWSIDYDYRLDGDVALSGTYDEAISKILEKFSAVRPQPYGQLHQLGRDQRILVVKSYDLAG